MLLGHYTKGSLAVFWLTNSAIYVYRLVCIIVVFALLMRKRETVCVVKVRVTSNLQRVDMFLSNLCVQYCQCNVESIDFPQVYFYATRKLEGERMQSLQYE
jgi:hypothetical protein